MTQNSPTLGCITDLAYLGQTAPEGSGPCMSSYADIHRRYLLRPLACTTLPKLQDKNSTIASETALTTQLRLSGGSFAVRVGATYVLGWVRSTVKLQQIPTAVEPVAPVSFTLLPLEGGRLCPNVRKARKRRIRRTFVLLVLRR